MSTAAGSGTAGPADERPFALPIDDFIAEQSEAPPPLIGSADDCILPAYGLLLSVAKGGKGKTTLVLDAILHLASGRAWLGFEVQRPLRVLLIENEGPREPFRRKLERRLGHWPHPLKGGIHVYDEDWGQARLDEAGFVEQLNRYVADNEIDLVVGDPLDTLGMEGVGSPQDTREMVARLQRAGLSSRVAWWILHHARKEKVGDSIDEASGSWGGKPDALLGLEKLPGGRARLGFHKLRWARRDGFSYLLSYDRDSEAFEFLEEGSEEHQERDYVVEIEVLLGDGGWRTPRDIAAPPKKGGIGAKRETVEGALQANPDRFVLRTGDAAKQVGKSRKAKAWGLARRPEPVEPESRPVEDAATAPASGSPYREPEPASRPSAIKRKQARRQEPQSGSPGCQSHPDSPAEGCRYCRAANDGAAR